jgi:hypothetical protein
LFKAGALLILEAGRAETGYCRSAYLKAIAREIGGDIASPDEAQAILSLNPTWKNRIIDPRENQITSPASSNTR